MNKKILRYGRWLVGLLILYFVFRQIELLELKKYLLKSDRSLIGIGLLHAPLLIITGAIRWRYILIQYFKPKLTIRNAIGHYWSGVAIGFFTPASLGLDAYRIIVSGRVYGKYSINIFTILIEKVIALITCASLFIILYPVVPMAIHPQMAGILFSAYVIMLLLVFCFWSIKQSRTNKVFAYCISKVEIYAKNLLQKLSQRYGFNKINATSELFISDLLKPLTLIKIVLIIAFTLGIQFISSLKSQIFFCAIGYNIPFIVNLFVAPTLYFIFMLPISFGSLGIREGAYILLYGLFGIPAEIALIVSFYNLIGIALNNLIGGIVMVFAKQKVKKFIDTEN